MKFSTSQSISNMSRSAYEVYIKQFFFFLLTGGGLDFRDYGTDGTDDTTATTFDELFEESVASLQRFVSLVNKKRPKSMKLWSELHNDRVWDSVEHPPIEGSVIDCDVDHDDSETDDDSEIYCAIPDLCPLMLRLHSGSSEDLRRQTLTFALRITSPTTS